ncbi:Lrp/AsnC family transcriptional regulator [Nocardioides daeguensis]|uniref:Lrp/AsnC family transcriptional regulator n=1 Tax=Nocardioides daeguensis TaxID=908359 RepID=A0ABP6UYF5_9ACTN|nr:Lrp/AsnC family transcriptional regulator [Nocardioides daeguensis]MBV6725975.1 Lrp/AsnC family transcriptional regulator [Nocardioides daeguensis]MCR1772509.1 Lrp/AsnC family transcriptional regulator [Nocardioides daeguensis]
MDPVDRGILDVLRADSRTSIREVAERLGISRTSAYARVKRLVDSGVIRGFTIDVDHAALGLGLPAYIHVRIKQNTWKSFRSKVWAMEEAAHVALVAGDFDCVILVRARDAEHLRELVLERIQALPEVVATQTVLVFEEHVGHV